MNIFCILISSAIWYLYGPRLFKVMKYLFQYSKIMTYFCIFFTFGLILIAFLIKKRKWFFLTSSHESAHKIMAVLLLSPVTEYHVNQDGSGSIMHSGKRFRRLISFAPYFFFPIPILIIIFSLLFKEDSIVLLVCIYSFLIGLRFAIIVFDISRYKKQTDITQYGVVPSLITISALLLLSIGILMSYLLEPFTLSGIKFFLFDVFK